MLLIVLIIDITYSQSDVWVDLPLLGAAIQNFINGILIYRMKRLLEEIEGDLIGSQGDSDQAYNKFYLAFCSSCIVVVIIGFICYGYYLHRDMNDIENIIQTQQQNHNFIIINFISIALSIIELIVIFLLTWQDREKNQQARNFFYVALNVIIFAQLIVDVVAVIMDYRNLDFLPDFAICGLVLSNLFTTLSLSPLWTLMVSSSLK